MMASEQNDRFYDIIKICFRLKANKKKINYNVGGTHLVKLYHFQERLQGLISM